MGGNVFEWHAATNSQYKKWELVGPRHSYGGTSWATIYDTDWFSGCDINIAETWYRFDALVDGQLLRDMKELVEDGYKDLIKDNHSC